MNSLRLRSLAAAALLSALIAAHGPAFAISISSGPVPSLNYQGFLTDANGVPVNGQVTIRFRIYDVETGGTPLYSTTKLVTVTDGAYSEYIGGYYYNNGNWHDTLLPTDWNRPLWLGITVGSDAEMTPRHRLAAAPYAHTAGDQNGFLVKGELGIGTIPATGAGDRMMWYAFKNAFRSGKVDGDEWDDSNIGFFSWAGGWNTRATSYASFAFGDKSVASGNYAMALGNQNTASGSTSIALGYQSTASGSNSIAAGYQVQASGVGTVAIGRSAAASGDYSLALGRGSSAQNAGAIVLSDSSTTEINSSTANNQFTVRAAGGTRIFTNASRSSGVTLNAGGSSWNFVSDRNAKTDFKAVDTEEVLEKLAALPMTTWRYHDEEGAPRHMGPMAQDFRAAFGLGSNDVTINTIDIDGVNMAAIQGLERRTRELRVALGERDARIAALQQELVALKAHSEQLQQERVALDRRLDRLEGALITVTEQLAPPDARAIKAAAPY